MQIGLIVAHCPNCDHDLIDSGDQISEGYAFACPQCDEDFYEIEVKNYSLRIGKLED